MKTATDPRGFETTLGERFAEQVRLRGPAPAVDDGDQVLSYDELDVRTREAAQVLRSVAGGAQARVVLLARQGIDAIVATLGILRAGHAYVPLDAALPLDALREMVASAEPAAIVTEPGFRAVAEQLRPAGVTVLEPGDLRGPVQANAAPASVSPDDVAYLYYTSGSTGKPKGVYDSHRHVLHNIWRYTTLLGIGPEDRLTLLQSPPFSGTVSSLFAALLNGAVSLPYDVRTRGLAPLGAWLRARRATIFHAVPAIFREALAEGAPAELRCVRLEGDQASRRDLELFRQRCAPGTVLANGLGATECGLVRQWRITPESPWPEGPIPIGTPVPDMEIALRAEDGSEVAEGGIGQITVRSAYLALGYWRQPELTATRFLADPADPSRRIYLTGDLGRMLGGGLLQYLGRKDFQARLNGEWIDTEALERALLAAPGVKDVAVAVHSPADGTAELVAYLVPREDETLDRRRLRDHLQQHCPGARIPSRWCRLAALPLNDNLKVDRRRLPPPDESGWTQGDVVEPRNAVERQLASLWSEVLERPSVGVEDNFLEWGGDSLRAMRLVARIQASFGREMPFQEVFARPTIAAQAAWLQEAPALVPPESRAAGGNEGVLSFAEERLWFLDRLEHASRAYHVVQALRLRGPLDRPALERALRRLVERHDALRTRYQTTPEGVRRVVSVPEEFAVATLAGAGGSEDAELTAVLVREAERPFDLERGPLFRAALVTLAPEDQALLLTWHHGVTDGLSQPVFHRDLGALYAAERGRAVTVPPVPPVSYADYARRQRAPDDRRDQLLAEVKTRLTGVPPLELVLERAVAGAPDGGAGEFEVQGERARRLRERQRAEQATAFQVFLAAFAAWLGRVADQSDFAIGVPVNDRPGPEYDGVVGLFVNSVAVRADLAGEPDFSALIRWARRVGQEAIALRSVPFEQVVEALNPPRGVGQHPIFQVMFAWQEPAEAGRPVLDGVQVSEWSLPVRSSHFDLELHVTPSGEGWLGSLVYRTARVAAPAAERLVGQFLAFLDALLAQPERSVWRLPWRAEGEPDSMRGLSADGGAEPACIHSLVTAQARRTPDRVAVEDGSVRWTFQDVDRSARNLAAQLVTRGVGPGDRVGVCLGRTAWIVPALLGILHAGAAYVPVDPEWPAARKALVLGDAGVRVLVTQRSLASRLTVPAVTLVWVDDKSTEVRGTLPEIDPLHAAYVIYTSGTTGRPKGVVVEHRSVVSLLRGLAERLRVTADDVTIALGSLAFDISVAELFLPLVTGARLIIGSEEARRDGRVLARLIEDGGVTLLQATPATWRMLVDAGWRGRPGLRAATGGEPLTPALAEALLPRVAELWNLYGPTEATVYALGGRVKGSDQITIGRPFPRVQVRITDRRGELRPVGLAGELVLGGEGLARGYLGNPEATRDRFVDGPDGRWYRTGDVARWTTDGTVEILGRWDDQVKVRGVRIQLGEVETALRSLPEVAEAAVVVERDAVNEASLVAFVVARAARGETLRRVLRSRLEELLPPGVIPADFVLVDALPRSTSGKLDRAALLASRTACTPPAAELQPVADAFEEEIRAVWQEHFPAVPVGTGDNFFELGGHSLLAARLAGKLEQRLGRAVSVADVFLAPTVVSLARILRQASGSSAHWVALQPSGSRAPLICLHGWGGGVQGFAPLAQALAPVRPVFGLTLPETFARGPGSLEALAELHADEIGRRCAEGPIHLVGHSAGGWLALAVAQALAKRGRAVATLAILDTEPLFRLPWNLHLRVQAPFLLRRLREHARTWRRVGLKEGWRQLRDRGAALRAHLVPRAGIDERHPDPTVAAVARFRPTRYDGEVVLLTVAESNPRLPAVWRHFARRGVVVRPIGGTHGTLLEAAHAPELARVLEAAMREREQAGG